MEYCLGSVHTKWGAVRAADGHPKPYHVKYWELGNKVWKIKPDTYIKLIKRYVPAMRKRYPGIKIIACGSGAMSGQDLKIDTAVITKAASYVDYISIHYYENPSNFATGIENWKEFMDGLQKMINDSRNPQMKVFMSEWNLNTTDMRTGLYAAGLLNAMEKTPLIAMASPALFLRHVGAPGWNNAFINFNQYGWFPAPNYVVMKLWRNHYAPDRIALSGNLTSLNIIATRSANAATIYIKTVNANVYPVNIKLNVNDHFNVAKANFKFVTADSLTEENSMDHPHLIRIRNGVVKKSEHQIMVTVPGWSASVLTVKNR